MSSEKVALIIAGGSGIGAAAARQLANDGFKIGILSSSGKGKSLAEKLGGFGVTGSNLSKSDLSLLVSGAQERWRRVDVVVNSAGHGPKGSILEISDEEWFTGMEIYLLNVIRVAQLVTPLMMTNGGSIVNISSFAAFEPDPSFPTSAVFRAGLSAFTKLFVGEYAANNIRMNNILPGFINSLPETNDRMSRIPMLRYGRVEEVASLIALLASEKASYITGQDLIIDGGLTRAM